MRSEFEVKLSTVEEDSYSVVLKVTEASGICFEGLNAAVETFADGVGNVMLEVRQNVRKPVLDHLGNLHHRLQTAATGPGIPTLKIGPGAARVAVRPEPTEVFLQRPRSRGLQLLVS